MVKITKIRYGRVFNIGNYESERIDLEGDVETEYETVEYALETLKQKVESLRTKR